MNKRYFALISLLLPLSLFAQKVPLLTVDQLNQRISNGKDTVYVVNFWATWCSPCVKELPYFEQFANTMKQQPVKVLLVSVDFRSKLETSVKPFVKRKKLRNEVFLLNEKDPQSFFDKIDKNWSGAIPATLVVNAAKRKRQFIEKELTYNELLNLYKRNK